MIPSIVTCLILSSTSAYCFLPTVYILYFLWVTLSPHLSFPFPTISVSVLKSPPLGVTPSRHPSFRVLHSELRTRYSELSPIVHLYHQSQPKEVKDMVWFVCVGIVQLAYLSAITHMPIPGLTVFISKCAWVNPASVSSFKASRPVYKANTPVFANLYFAISSLAIKETAIFPPGLRTLRDSFRNTCAGWQK